jgi:hypothetical protein
MQKNGIDQKIQNKFRSLQIASDLSGKVARNGMQKEGLAVAWQLLCIRS